jgi:hypothetical protein
VRSRGDFGDVNRVDFEELAPAIDTFLGQAAYLQLGYFETLSELIAPTPELSQKESISRAAGRPCSSTRSSRSSASGRRSARPLMLPFREPLDAFRRATHGARHLETMLSVHITAGMLDDFYLALSAATAQRATASRRSCGRRRPAGARPAHHRRDRRRRAVARPAVAVGRRLVGDTLLIAAVRCARRPWMPRRRRRSSRCSPTCSRRTRGACPRSGSTPDQEIFRRRARAHRAWRARG